MRRSLALLLIASVALSACAGARESRLNPLNWFGNSRETPVVADRAPTQAETTEANPLIPNRRQNAFQRRRAEREIYIGQPVDVIEALIVEQVPGGAMIRVEGSSRFQNVYDVRLTPVNAEEEPVDGILAYRLEAIIPERPIAGGTERQRRVIAARVLTDQQLSQVREIRVSATQNARATSR